MSDKPEERLHDVDALRAQRDAAVRVVEAVKAQDAAIEAFGTVDSDPDDGARAERALARALADYDAGAARGWRET